MKCRQPIERVRWSALATLIFVGCASESAEKTARALAVLESVSDALSADLKVEISLVREGERTTASFTAQNCPEGAHAVHIHRGTRCGADGSAAGPKWMPAGPIQKHGGGDEHDDSSIGKIYCKADGTSHYIFATDGWELGAGSAFDPTGQAVVLYATDSTARIACGVIELAE
jgi:Cu/Zn superoxide dismutase